MRRVEEITTSDALERLLPEWSDLWGRCPSATPFQSPEWLLPWWRCFGPGALWVLAVREGERLVGLAPFFIQPTNDVTRHLSFIGCGISDYLDVLAEPQSSRAIAGEMLAHLARHQSEWDRCDLGDLCPESPLLSAPTPDELRAEIHSGEICTFVPLPESPEEYTRSLPWHLRRDLRSGGNRLRQAGNLRFEEAGASTLGEMLEALFRLHQSRWNDRNLPGVLGEEAIHLFHHKVAPGLLARHRLRLYSLRLDDEIIAVLHVFARADRLYLYLTGFEPRLKRLSLGSLMLHRTIEQAIEAGMHELDFMRGSESYKYAWGARERPTRRLLLLKKSAAHMKAAPARAAASRSMSSLPTKRVSAGPIP